MSRNSRLTADVTLEAHNMLRQLAKDKERSKGWLIEKMIRTYCVSTEPTQKEPIKAKSTSFKPPTVDEVQSYCAERCNNVDAQEFVDHYTANNWFRGKTKIKDWRACVRTWEKNSVTKQVKSSGKTQGNLSACEDFIND